MLLRIIWNNFLWKNETGFYCVKIKRRNRCNSEEYGNIFTEREHNYDFIR